MTRSGRAGISDVAVLARDVAGARADVQRLLAGRWAGDLDLVLIAVHEALINADRHGAGIREASARLDGDLVIVEVADYGGGFDHHSYVGNQPDVLAERGRGLWLIHQIASSFHLVHEAEGTRLIVEFSPSQTGVRSAAAHERPPLPDVEHVARTLIRSFGAAVAIIDRNLVLRAAWGDVEGLLGVPLDRVLERDARGLTAELKSRFQDPMRYEQRILDDYAQPDQPTEELFVRRDGRILRRQSMPFTVDGHHWRMVSYLPVAGQTQIVAAVQRSLLPELPRWPDLEVAAVYHAAEASSFVGGDFYDFIELSSGGRCLAVGDVSGRGPAAAATSTHVRAYLRASLRSHGVTAAVPDLDATLSAEFTDEQFVTLAMCVQESADVWTHTGCGHPPALLLHSGEVKEVGGRGGALGLGLPAEWPREPFVLNVGDVLLLFTDGVPDAGRRDRRFGVERLKQVFCDVGDMAVEDIVRAMDERVHAFSGDHLEDDHVLVAVRRKPVDRGGGR